MLELNEILKDNTNYNNDKGPSPKKKSIRRERQKRRNSDGKRNPDYQARKAETTDVRNQTQSSSEWFQTSSNANQRPSYNYQSLKSGQKSSSSSVSSVHSNSSNYTNNADKIPFCGLTLTQYRDKRDKMIKRNLTIIMVVLITFCIYSIRSGNEQIQQETGFAQYKQFDEQMGMQDLLGDDLTKPIQTQGQNNGIINNGGLRANTNSIPNGNDEHTLHLAKRFMQIQEIVRPISGYDALVDSTSPQFRALDWIANRDSYQINPSDPLLIQRYALAVLYFATNGVGWKNQLNWLSGVHECQWTGDGGVRKCNNDGKVTDLSLWNNLKGTIPKEVTQLDQLEVLYLARNELRGTIPPEIQNLRRLSYLGLQHNKLTGTIPKESFANLSQLKFLYLEKNDLTGTILRSELPCLLMANNNQDPSTQQIRTAMNDANEDTSLPPPMIADAFSSQGNLEFFTSDCRSLLSFKSPEITCACCTQCYLA